MANNLYLIRHGLIRANVQGHWHGSTDSPLLWRGRRQARRTAKRIQGHDPHPVAVYTSPLQRCRDTAQPIVRGLGLAQAEVVEDLREYGIGEWEGMRFADLATEYNFVPTATRDADFAPPGGESLAQVAARMVTALTQLHDAHADDEDVVIVSHGAVMAVGLASMLDGNPSQWTDYHFSNCSVTQLTLGHNPFVTEFNCTRHL